jgi:hypothetical protein
MNAVSARARSAIREGSMESTLAWTDDTRRHYARRAACRASGPPEDGPGLRPIGTAARVVGTSARFCLRPGTASPDPTPPYAATASTGGSFAPVMNATASDIV